MALRDTFLDHLAVGLRASFEGLADLEARLAQMTQDARGAWPGVAVSDEAFLKHVASQMVDGSSAANALESLHAGDLFLACGCALRDSRALDGFSALLDDKVRASLRRLGPEDVVADLLQGLLAKMLVGDEKRPPALARYGGRAKLVTWVKTVATRDAFDALRARKRDQGDDLDKLFDHAIEVDDPELATLKRVYRAHFKQAFQTAFAELSVKERNVLRHECLDGLNIDEIGVLYGAHRSTVARWRAAARAALFTRTRRLFRERLDLSQDELASMMRLIDSQLDVSLQRLLRGEDKGPA